MFNPYPTKLINLNIQLIKTKWLKITHISSIRDKSTKSWCLNNISFPVEVI